MRFHYALAAAASLALAPSAAQAATFFQPVVDSIVLHNSDPGLVVYANANPSIASRTLNAGESYIFDVLRIGTNETSINAGEDTFAYPISVNFSFLSPTGASAGVGGTTNGVREWFGIIQYGTVDWQSEQSFFFGNGGEFKLELFDANFSLPNFFNHYDGSALVKGKITLISDSLPGVPGGVPEPSTWALMILGFGAIGASMRSSRKRPQLRVSYS